MRKTPPYLDSPEHLELIARTRPELLSSENWKTITQLAGDSRAYVIQMLQQPTQQPFYQRPWEKVA